MKRNAFVISFILFLVAQPFCTWGQEKKPTLMILPSDNWCHQRFFLTTYNNQGSSIEIPDYQLAFQEDSELPAVVSKIGQLLTSKGYSLKDAEQELKSIYARIAEDNVTVSKNGSMLAETPLDVIKRKVKMDIVVQIWWKVNKEPSGRSVNFTLEAFDSYTNKRIATSSGISDVAPESVPLLLEKAAQSHIKEFDKQMMSFYKDIHKNGREIILTIRRWDGWDCDLETEFDGEELIDCIRKWIKKNSLNGAYNLSDATENMAQFEQVRIPLLDEDGDGLDARGFAVGLRKYLSKEYGITSKVMTRGLGEAIIVLGEK